MKKFKLFIFTVAILITLGAFPISAQATQTNALVNATLTDKSTGEQVNVKVTPILLKASRDEQMSDSYEVRVILPTDAVRPQSSDSSTDQDGYYSVTGKPTITYDRSLDSHNNYSYKLNKVSGSWTVNDKSVKLSNRSVSRECSRFLPRVVQNGKKSPTSNSFSYNTGFSKYIWEYDMDAWVGATSLVDISKGARKWDLQIDVKKLENNT